MRYFANVLVCYVLVLYTVATYKNLRIIQCANICKWRGGAYYVTTLPFAAFYTVIYILHVCLKEKFTGDAEIRFCTVLAGFE